jgi:hypothetical protein
MYCEECRLEARGKAKGWVAFLVDLPDEPDDEPAARLIVNAR